MTGPDVSEIVATLMVIVLPLVGVVLSIAMISAVLRIFSIDRTLKAILSELQLRQAPDAPINYREVR